MRGRRTGTRHWCSAAIDLLLFLFVFPNLVFLTYTRIAFFPHPPAKSALPPSRDVTATSL